MNIAGRTQSAALGEFYLRLLMKAEYKGEFVCTKICVNK